MTEMHQVSHQRASSPRWAIGLTIAVIVSAVLGLAYLLFAYDAKAHTVSGGSVAMWLYVFTFIPVMMFLLAAAVVGIVTCFGMRNWRDRFITFIAAAVCAGACVLIIFV